MMHALWRNSAKRTRTRNAASVATEGEEGRRGNRHVHLFVDCMYPTCSKKRSRPRSSRNKNHHHHHRHHQSSSSNPMPVPVPRVTTYLEPNNMGAPAKEALPQRVPPPSALPSTEITFMPPQQRSTTPLSTRQHEDDEHRLSGPESPTASSVVTVSILPPTDILSQEAPPFEYSDLQNISSAQGDASPRTNANTNIGLSQYVEGDFTEELSGLELDNISLNINGHDDDNDNPDETRLYSEKTYEYTNGNTGANTLRMDDETRRWTGNEREDEFIALEAADQRHSFTISDAEHDNAMFSSRARTSEWIEDIRRHNCNHLLRRTQPPLDIRQFAAYIGTRTATRVLRVPPPIGDKRPQDIEILGWLQPWDWHQRVSVESNH